MHFLKFPNSLWFFQAGQGAEVQVAASLAANITVSVSETSVAFGASTSTIPFSISAGYNISLSAWDVTSVQIELSAIQYKVSTSANTSLLAFLSADGILIDGLNARVTVTPVYTLSQSGQVNQCVSAAYNVTVSAATGSIASYITISGGYNVSASGSAALLISNQYSVSAAYNVSTSMDFTLSRTLEAITKSETLIAPITCSLTPILVIDGGGGGLVWSRKKKRRIPVRVGYPLRDE